MPETRYQELLGLPVELEDPDYYQLLAMERSLTDAAAIEARFKEQMTRLQKIENPRHKEFIEYLKGELKRARGVLTDAARRREYDQQLLLERGEELRKILAHMLVDKQLSTSAEQSVQSEGRNLGLDPWAVKKIIEEEIQKAGAKRIANKSSDRGTQVMSDKRAQEFAREMQEARIQARIAQSRAVAAEVRERRAEDESRAAQEKARQAQVQARRAINAEHVATAQAEQEAAGFEEKARKMADESMRVASQLEETKRRIAEADAVVQGAQAKIAGARRIAIAHALVAAVFVGIQAAKFYAPAAMEGITKAVSSLTEKLGAQAAVGAGLGVVAAMLVLTILLSRKAAAFVPMVLAGVLAGAVSLLL